MNRTQFVQHLEKTYAEALAIVTKKNQDYGADSDPFKNFRLVGHLDLTSVETGIMVRLCDKFARLSNLIGGKAPAVTDESLDDTLLDAINYLAILRAYLAAKRPISSAEPQAYVDHLHARFETEILRV